MNGVPVKSAPCWLNVAEHPSEQPWVGGTERATSEHQPLFLHSGLKEQPLAWKAKATYAFVDVKVVSWDPRCHCC